MVVNREDLAWAAGLFEGEGCFSGWSGYGKKYMQCILSTTDKDVLEKFQRIIGLGNIHPEPLKEGYKQAWRWRVSSFEDFQAVVALLWFRLGERRREKVVNLLTSYHNCGNRYGTPVDEVFRLRGLGMTQQSIANQFGCTQANISSILLGKHGNPRKDGKPHGSDKV